MLKSRNEDFGDALFVHCVAEQALRLYPTVYNFELPEITVTLNVPRLTVDEATSMSTTTPFPNQRHTMEEYTGLNKEQVRVIGNFMSDQVAIV